MMDESREATYVALFKSLNLAVDTSASVSCHEHLVLTGRKIQESLKCIVKTCFIVHKALALCIKKR